MACCLLQTADLQDYCRIDSVSDLVLTPDCACTYGHRIGGVKCDEAGVFTGHGDAHRLDSQSDHHPDAERDGQNEERLQTK